MKNLPTFIQNYLTDCRISEGQTKKAINFISAVNQLPDYSDQVSWFIGKQELASKPAFYSLPLISAGKVLSWCGKSYNGKTQKNTYTMTVRSDKGVYAPVHLPKQSRAFFHLNDVEKILLSFENYGSPKIFFNESMDKFFGSVVHESGNFEILLTGSFDETFSANLFLRNNLGIITKIGRSNRHTLNFDLKRVEQLNEIEKEFEVSEREIFRFLDKLETVKGTFDQFYSRIFLGGGSVKDIPSKSKAKYNNIKACETEEVQTLKDFFLVCSKYDNILINNIPEKVLVQSAVKNYIIVSKYAKTKLKLISKLPPIK